MENSTKGKYIFLIIGLIIGVIVGSGSSYFVVSNINNNYSLSTSNDIIAKINKKTGDVWLMDNYNQMFQKIKTNYILPNVGDIPNVDCIPEGITNN